jgi:hypothetical protein
VDRAVAFWEGKFADVLSHGPTVIGMWGRCTPSDRCFRQRTRCCASSRLLT